MKRLYSMEEVRRADQEKIASGESAIVLMEKAAEELSKLVWKVMAEKNFSEVIFVCGGGNNGGDGFAAARLLEAAGKEVYVLCLAHTYSPECAEMRKRFTGTVLNRIPRRKYELLIDCVLGTGISRAPEGDAKALIDFMNSCGGYVIACDVPSGLSENGAAYFPCVHADQTLSIGGMKRTLFMGDGVDLAGNVSVANLSLPLKGGISVWEMDDVKSFFSKKPSHVNKGDYGSAAFFLDRAECSGAVFLASQACLKSGAGYTKLYANETLLSVSVGKLPSVVLRVLNLEEALSATAIAYGMGAGISKNVYDRICEILRKYEGILILDADALNTLAEFGIEILKEKRCRIIITPHLGEFSRLTSMSIQEVLSTSCESARAFASKYDVTVVLKNNRTIITDGIRLALNVSGSPVLAKGGSGDILSGLIAGSCARGIEPFESACLSSYLLGEAGEMAGEEMGEYAPDASDLLCYLSKTISNVSGKGRKRRS